jgi:hypothetical protein
MVRPALQKEFRANGTAIEKNPLERQLRANDNPLARISIDV